MAVQVSRSDTGQYVLIDPATDTVVIDDDLAGGFAKLEQATAGQSPKPAAAATASTTPGSSFAWAGGPGYLPVLLAVVVPFVWLAALYFALANLLSEHALDRAEAKRTQDRIHELERELQALRSEISGAPRVAKTKPKPQNQAKAKPASPDADADDHDDQNDQDDDDENSDTEDAPEAPTPR